MNYQNPNKICGNAFNCYGETALPKSVRTYLDGGSSEFHEIDIEKKLYHIGYLLKRGHDLYADFRDDIDSHLQNPQYGGYEDEAKRSLEMYISYLRNGKKTYSVHGDYTFKQLYDMFARKLEKCYHETKDWQTGEDVYEFERHITEDDLRDCNGWAEVAERLVGYDLYFENEEFIFPGDEELVGRHNERQKNADERFVLQVPPEPWNGDILNPKIVVLSLNPGYVERLNKDLANMFKAQVAEEIMEDKRQMLRMEQKSVVPHISTSILGECYWEKALVPLGKAAYGAGNYRQVYRDVALLQFLAYTSAVKSLPAEILPSQQFTRMLIRYLAEEKKSVKFLLMRAEKEWRRLIDKDVWAKLESEGRIIISDHYRNQSITENNVGAAKFKALVDALKK